MEALVDLESVATVPVASLFDEPVRRMNVILRADSLGNIPFRPGEVLRYERVITKEEPDADESEDNVDF